MNKIFTSLMLVFWSFAIAYMLFMGIKCITLEPTLSLIGFLGFIVFLFSGIQVILPEFIEAFAKEKEGEE